MGFIAAKILRLGARMWRDTKGPLSSHDAIPVILWRRVLPGSDPFQTRDPLWQGIPSGTDGERAGIMVFAFDRNQEFGERQYTEFSHVAACPTVGDYVDLATKPQLF